MLLAAPRGYCAGVDRAVITVEKALDLYGAPVYVRKQIVHNKHVVADLESRGAIFVEELDEVPEGATVVFSAHGVSPEVHAQAAERAAEDDRRDLPAGDQGAPRGEAVRRRRLRHPADRPRGPRGGRGHRRRGARAHPARRRAPATSPASWSATRRRSPGSRRPRCRSTRRWRRSPRSASGSRCCSTRRATTSATPPRTASSRSRRSPSGADLVIVVGSGNSSNSVRLVEVALEAGARAAYRVDDATEIDEAWLDGRDARSASPRARACPRTLVDGVLALPRRARLPRRRRPCTAPRSR